MNWKWFGRKRSWNNRSTNPEFSWRDWEKHRKLPFMITDIHAEIRPNHFQNPRCQNFAGTFCLHLRGISRYSNHSLHPNYLHISFSDNPYKTLSHWCACADGGHTSSHFISPYSVPHSDTRRASQWLHWGRWKTPHVWCWRRTWVSIYAELRVANSANLVTKFERENEIRQGRDTVWIYYWYSCCS
jgi:hypothetical protein